MRHGQWITSLAITLAMAGTTGRGDERPSWQCLPADTAVMVRFPGLSGLLEALRSQTRFGAVAMRQERLDGLWQAVVGEADREGGFSPEEFEDSLRKYGLEPADIWAMFDREMGGGLVARSRRDEKLPTLGMVLGWIEPGPEAAGRFLEAVRRRLEEDAGGDGPVPRRVDMQLAGHDVVSVIFPVQADEPADGEAEAEEGAEGNGRPGAGVQIGGLRMEVKPSGNDAVTGQTHGFHAVVGGRFLFGYTLPVSAAGDPPATPDEHEPRCGGEEGRRIFEAFLAAHAGGGEPALDGVLREPALAAVPATAVPLVEAVIVPRMFWEAEEPPADADPGKLLAEVGFDDLGGVVWRQGLEDGRWRSTMAVTMPAPRHGLMSFLDQKCDASEVPSFVTREVADFTQISLDLGGVFQAVREWILSDPEAEQIASLLNVADAQAQAVAGADVTTLLSGFGTRHWLLSFPPRIEQAIAAARAEGDAAEPAPTDRVALVWQIADEQPFLKLLGMLAVQGGGGELEEEQGFRGTRLPAGPAFFIGRGHLVMAVGEGVLEKTLASIRNPPAGDASLRESDVPRRAAALMPLGPARIFGVGDASRSGGSLGMLRELVAALRPEDVEPTYRGLLTAVQELLPTAAEMEGMFGVSATALRMTDDGLVFETAWEMPSP